MGINIFKRSSFSNYDGDNLPNPNPLNYTIKKSEKINNYLVIKIKYHDCTNYEGNKILLFFNCGLDELKNQKSIDPHFSENKNYHSPIARFEPTKSGWENACKLANILK